MNQWPAMVNDIQCTASRANSSYRHNHLAMMISHLITGLDGTRALLCCPLAKTLLNVHPSDQQLFSEQDAKAMKCVTDAYFARS